MRSETGLNSDELEHSARVRALLLGAIAAADGWISFERYMYLALYAPGLGYYSAGTQKMGAGGDFVTAPEVSPLFGACVARQCAEVLHELESGSICELGAGTGQLAVDVLTRLDSLACLPDRYYIVEVSADLRERQRTLLAARVPQYLARVMWLDAPPSPALDGVILANEVLDALPVARFRWQRGACAELGVTCSGTELTWAPRAAPTWLAADVDELAAAAPGWRDGYESEYCPRLRPFGRLVAESLRRGAVFWFDYGLPRPQYYLPERHEGTLLCHLRQRAFDDPFRYPGLQDITAWVDFTSLAEAGAAAGCEVAGFTTQAFFLAGLGIDGEMRAMADGDDHCFARLANQAKRLMLPGEMGERFKAMAWLRDGNRNGERHDGRRFWPVERALSGFALQDLRHSL